MIRLLMGGTSHLNDKRLCARHYGLDFHKGVTYALFCARPLVAPTLSASANDAPIDVGYCPQTRSVSSSVVTLCRHTQLPCGVRKYPAHQSTTFTRSHGSQATSAPGRPRAEARKHRWHSLYKGPLRGLYTLKTSSCSRAIYFFLAASRALAAMWQGRQPLNLAPYLAGFSWAFCEWQP